MNLLNQTIYSLGFSIDENRKGRGYIWLLRDDKIRKLKRKTALEVCKHNPCFADFVAQIQTPVFPSPPDN